MSQVRVLLDHKWHVILFLSRAKNELYYGKTRKIKQRRNAKNDHRIASGIRLYCCFLYRCLHHRYWIQHHQMAIRNPYRTDQIAGQRPEKDFSYLRQKRRRTHYIQRGLAFFARWIQVYLWRSPNKNKKEIKQWKKLFVILFTEAILTPHVTWLWCATQEERLTKQLKHLQKEIPILFTGLSNVPITEMSANNTALFLFFIVKNTKFSRYFYF